MTGSTSTVVHGLRPAVPSDVPAMATLINRYAAQELMLPKTPAALFAAVRDYLVAVDLAGNLVACAGLRVYSAASAEIVGLAVTELWQGRGVGGLLVDRLVEEARTLGIHRVFAMTLSEGFFVTHGFQAVPRGLLPEKEEGDCVGCARRRGCREIAVQRVLVEGVAGVADIPLPAPRARSESPVSRELPVVGALRA